MNTDVYYTEENMKDVLEKICECGHKLSYHGFTSHYSEITNQPYFVVSQCIFCGENSCKEFKEAKK